MRQEIHNFFGIAPSMDDNLQPGYASIAQNVDLSTKKIRPLLGHRKVSNLGAGADSILNWGGSWRTGTGKFYAPWVYGSTNLLYYLTGNTIHRTIGATESQAGLALPNAPTAALNGAGALTGDFQYFVVEKRDVSGYLDWSGPSAVTAVVTAAANTIRVTRGAMSNADATHWWIYRLGSTTGSWNFVAEVAAATTFYDDTLDDEDLGEGPLTYYDSAQGNVVLLTRPGSMDGLCRDFFYGSLIGWNGAAMYASEPTLPDSWDQDVFAMRFQESIKGVHLIGTQMLVVLTEKKAVRIVGTEPELYVPDDSLHPIPPSSGDAVEGKDGLYYPSPEGIALFDGTVTHLFSAPEFDRQWFKANVQTDSAFMSYWNKQIWMGHPGGVLICDQRTEPRSWTTLSSVFTAFWVDKETRTLYGAMEDGIYEIFGLPYFMESDYLNFVWQSADIDFNTPQQKRGWSVEVLGEREIHLSVYIDGAQVGDTMTITEWDNPRRRRLTLSRSKGRACQVRVTGTGEVKSIVVEASL